LSFPQKEESGKIKIPDTRLLEVPSFDPRPKAQAKINLTFLQTWCYFTFLTDPRKYQINVEKLIDLK